MEISRGDRRTFIGEQGRLPAEFTFPFMGKQVMGTSHAFSDVSLRGQGIRGAPIREAAAVIRRKCWKCMAFSPYALTWMKKYERKQGTRMREEPR